MKPVDQTTFGQGNGNCFAACVASLLEIPLEAVPNFCVIVPDDHDWHEVFQTWLMDHVGLTAMTCKFESHDEAVRLLAGVWHIISGPSLRKGVSHSVVGYEGHMVYDPHPSREGLGQDDEYDIFVQPNPRAISVADTALSRRLR